MLRCSVCGDASPNDARFCIGCGRPVEVNPYYGATHRLETVPVTTIDDPSIREVVASIEPEQMYFIYRADLGAILKDTSTYVRSTDEGYEIYYHGRKVVFMD